MNQRAEGAKYHYPHKAKDDQKELVEEAISKLDPSWRNPYNRLFNKLKKDPAYSDRPFDAFRDFKLVQM